jgi:hypothetical protein
MIAFVIVVLLHFVRHLQAAGFLYALDSTRANRVSNCPNFDIVSLMIFSGAEMSARSAAMVNTVIFLSICSISDLSCSNLSASRATSAKCVTRCSLAN